MAGRKRAAAFILALLTLVPQGSVGPAAEIAARPQAVAALAEAAAEGAGIEAAAASAGGGSARESAGETASAQGTPAADAAQAAQTDSARAENGSARQPGLKSMRLPDISADAPAPAQVKRLPDSGMVCLTFDDGYSKAAIETVLACLKEYDARCTFFIIGSCLKLYPELWQRAVAEGHEIAYHTMSHRPLTRCSDAQIVADINAWNRIAVSVLGAGYRIPRLARAPGGSADARVRRLFAALGYTLVYWSSDTFTGVYRRSRNNAAARAASYILQRTDVGSISLQHFNACDAASVSRYIWELASRFRLGTVSEALAAVRKRAQRQALTEALKQRTVKPPLCEAY